MPYEKCFTDSSIKIKNICTNQSGSENSSNKEILNEAAGEFPFTREYSLICTGGKLRMMRQYAGFSTAKKAMNAIIFIVTEREWFKCELRNVYAEYNQVEAIIITLIIHLKLNE